MRAAHGRGIALYLDDVAFYLTGVLSQRRELGDVLRIHLGFAVGEGTVTSSMM